MSECPTSGVLREVFPARVSLKDTDPGSEKAGTIFFTLRTTRFTIRPFTPSISPSEVTTTCLSAGRCPRTCCSTWPKFSRITSASAPESLS
mgnify:CR=1 FL=1